MKKILIVILLIFTIQINAQDSVSETLASENIKWVEDLEKITSKESKIKRIVEKIKSDSIIKERNHSDKIKIEVNAGENPNDALLRQTRCKILFILWQGRRKGYVLDLNKYPNHSSILNLLDEKNIDSIEILKAQKAFELYGVSAGCGYVLIKSQNKSLKKNIKKILKK